MAQHKGKHTGTTAAPPELLLLLLLSFEYSYSYRPLSFFPCKRKINIIFMALVVIVIKNMLHLWIEVEHSAKKNTWTKNRWSNGKSR
jgi:hypothetical protein